MGRLLLVDVVDPYRTAFGVWSAHQGIEAFSVEGEVPAFAEASDVQLAVLGSSEGEEALPSRVRALRKLHAHAPVVVLAFRCRIATVVELMRAGVADVIELPAPSVDVVERAAAHAREAALRAGAERLVGSGAAMQELRREIAAVATLSSTVLLCGETGTGKGLVARLIHELSSRRARPFVHVDCAALAPSVIESELFGHERGAFTGALGTRSGRFERAGHGTVFLDEIGELGPEIQTKLLRVLQDRAYERVGGHVTRFMPARVVAATSRDLQLEMREGRFRADLFFRLNVFRIALPPLRSHLDDVPALARAGIERVAARLQVSAPSLSSAFYARLAAYSWPGNVRELMNVLERVVIQSHAGCLDESDLDRILHEKVALHPAGDGGLPRASSPLDLHAGVGDERAHLEAELLAVGGNVSRAARRLRMARSTLRYRIRVHGLESLIPRD